MATFTAKRSVPLANTPGPLGSVVNLTLQDSAAGHVAMFTWLNPDDDHATFSTTDAAVITWLQGLIAGAGTEGYTVTQTA